MLGNLDILNVCQWQPPFILGYDEGNFFSGAFIYDATIQ
jgi:hypothetical protein